MEIPLRHKSITELMEDMKSRGFTENFKVDKEGLKSAEAGVEKIYSENQVRIIEHHRFEGISDPEDMSIVYGLETSDGKRGLLSDAFGVYSDPIVSEFMKSVEKNKDSGTTNQDQGTYC